MEKLNLTNDLSIRFARTFDITTVLDPKSKGSFKQIYEGTPWVTSLALKYGDNEFTLIECVISLSQEKNIVSTPLQGRDGTIKEFISDGDYQITIAAAVNNYHEKIEEEGEDNRIYSSFDYPKEKVQGLHELLKVQDTLIVESPFLALFGINSAVVKSYSLEQETHSNRQALQIMMISDEAYEIKLKNEEDVKTHQ